MGNLPLDRQYRNNTGRFRVPTDSSVIRRVFREAPIRVDGLQTPARLEYNLLLTLASVWGYISGLLPTKKGDRR